MSLAPGLCVWTVAVPSSLRVPYRVALVGAAVMMLNRCMLVCSLRALNACQAPEESSDDDAGAAGFLHTVPMDTDVGFDCVVRSEP